MFVVFYQGLSGKGRRNGGGDDGVRKTRERPGKDIERGEEAVERGEDLISPTFKREK